MDEFDHGPGPRTCGRPTKSGTPCKNQLSCPMFDVACHSHATAHERELATARGTAYRAGHRAGEKSAIGLAACEVQGLKRQVDALREQLHAANWRTTIGNAQIVEVDGRAYRWPGKPLSVGDRVVLPANWLSEIKYGPGPFEGTVTALGSAYSGDLSTVIDRVMEEALT